MRAFWPLAEGDGGGVVKYVMFICGDPDHSAADEAAAPPLEPWFEAARGVYQQGVRLQPIDDATSCASATASCS